MPSDEYTPLELLAEADDLVARLTLWTTPTSRWAAVAQGQALARRLLDRCGKLRVRLETPLVVATFGGTGCGKSSLVNALVGADVTAAGRQRPTTREPILLVHPELDVDAAGLPLHEVRVVRHDAPLLRHILILDCPDPDTNEAETPDSNLERLRKLLPWCDVLICVSTQQKYRSARVSEELLQAAAGCRLVFVQTHADLDTDIRADWHRNLQANYHVEDLFFVDSRAALQQQRQGLPTTGEFHRLRQLLEHELSAGQRVQIRRSNLLDLLAEGLNHCLALAEARAAAASQLATAIEQQQQQLTQHMTEQLCGGLRENRGLWERRLMGSVCQRWGLSPFGAILKLCHSQAALIASYTLMRARTPAQMVLIGGIQGARWLSLQSEATRAQSTLEQLGATVWSERDWRASELVIRGHARDAGLDMGESSKVQRQQWRHDLEQVETEFLADAQRNVDGIIERLAERRSAWSVRWFYELVVTAYVGFVLLRVGKNFFYESLWLDVRLLDSNFYIAALIFLVLIAGGALAMFLNGLRGGLDREIQQLARSLAQAKLGATPFSDVCEALDERQRRVEQLQALREQVESSRRRLAVTALGGRRAGH